MEESGKLKKNGEPIMIEKDITIFLPNGKMKEYSTEESSGEKIKNIELREDNYSVVRIIFNDNGYNEYHNIPFLYSVRIVEKN